MKVTEENFIPLLCRKQEKALEYCMLHYGGLVKAVVHRYLGSLPQYEEECQNDVFFAVWNHIDAYDPERNPFANWIAGVARLKALDCKRKYASRMLETSWEAMEETGQPVIHTAVSEELQSIEEEFSEETQQILACLKPKDRELFLRLYIEEENMEEVSQSTGLAKPVIYNRLSRGKKRIRSLFSASSERSLRL
ncbi:MAG TPA: sigma-70 family RNA polymerase sigma factor [Candidatus Blautia stercoravium]|nr:sigma-70 family RNA polymerase sigma factor [Candidatus Blautia stercoravium]